MTPPPSVLRRWARGAAVAVLVAAAGTAVAVAPATAAPVLGRPALTVLACRFADRPATPTTTAALDTLVRGSGRSLATWVRNTSRGHASLSSARVHGWFTMSLALDGLAGGAPAVVSACRSAALAAGVVLAPTAPVLVVVNDGRFSRLAETRGGPLRWDAPLEAWAHQLGHALGLAEAWSSDPATGQYRRGDDEYTVMGTFENPWPLVSARRTVPIGLDPDTRGLSAYELDRLSWLDERKVYTVGSEGSGTVDVRLSSIDVPAGTVTDGYELIRVPADPLDPTHYYTVELRLPPGARYRWNPEDGAPIRIHEIRGGVPFLLRDNSKPAHVDIEVSPLPLTHGRDPRKSFGNDVVSIGQNFDEPVDPVQTSGALVTITTSAAAPCRPGWVPRRATPRDAVCVTPERAATTAAWNADPQSRWSANGFVNARDWHFCAYPYVWREANSLDSVCVTPDERAAASDENRFARERADTSGLPTGPNWCAPGFVWREADRYDHVCVTPARRAEVAAENTRRCLWGDVRRDAWPTDTACVTPASKALAREENALAATRLARTDG